MPDVSVLSPNTNECIMTAHVKAQVRADELTGVVSGNDVAPSAGMVISVALGRIRVAGAPVDVIAAGQT